MISVRWIAVILAIVGLFVGSKALYIVPEAKQVVLTQFGRPVGLPVTRPGLHFKIPFIQELRYVDRRILSWDGEPNEVRTGDNKFIKVDTTARYKIVDALKFIQTVQSEIGARTRLDTVLDAATRDVISNHKLVEAVRNSNSILDEIERRKEQAAMALENIEVENIEEIDDQVTGEIDRITVGREELSEMIAKQAGERLEQFGIELVDVQLRRISYEQSVEQRVYERMISERQRIAEKLRSLGRGEQARIEGRINRELQEIESSAYEKAQILIGEGEAEAIRIFARFIGQDANFYQFLRQLQAYEKAIKPGSTLILSTESEFMKRLSSH